MKRTKAIAPLLIFLCSCDGAFTYADASYKDFFKEYPDSYSLPEGWYSYFVGTFSERLDENKEVAEYSANSKIVKFYLEEDLGKNKVIEGSLSAFYYQEVPVFYSNSGGKEEYLRSSSAYYLNKGVLARSFNGNVTKCDFSNSVFYKLSAKTYSNRWDEIIKDESIDTGYDYPDSYELHATSKTHDYEMIWNCTFSSTQQKFNSLEVHKYFRENENNKMNILGLWATTEPTGIYSVNVPEAEIEVPSLIF